MDSFLTALGLSKSSVIGGLIGSVISLRFLSELNVWQRVISVFSGMIVAAYCTPLVVELLSLKPSTEGAIAFLIGLFGMSLVGAIEKAIPDIVKSINERISR